MRHLAVLRAVVVCCLSALACGHGDGAGGAGSAGPPTTPAAPSAPSASSPAASPAAGSAASAGSAGSAVGSGAQVAGAPAPAGRPAPGAQPPLGGHDFTPAGKLLFVVGACAEGAAPPEYPAQLLARHCELVKAAQADYAERWVKKARAFFAERVPATAPKRVVYPFAGGDLSTALTVYPDADEITTLSLEPAGDPRTLEAMAAPPADAAAGKVARRPRMNPLLPKALDTIVYELKFLYRVNFSNTVNMIGAMRVGELPTQLVFGLSALKVHGYEVVSLRYFKLDEAGAVVYLTDGEVASAPDPLKGRAATRNQLFANAEVRFRKPGGREQIYRHIQVNLEDARLKEDPRVLRHLEAKGPISAMTKAASYLLSWDSFSTIRDYLTRNAVWMVSDATGVAPKWGKPAGFEYETYGTFTHAHLKEGDGISADWRKEWQSQPARPLPFRFGYYDKKINNHLVIMRKRAS